MLEKKKIIRPQFLEISRLLTYRISRNHPASFVLGSQAIVEKNRYPWAKKLIRFTCLIVKEEHDPKQNNEKEGWEERTAHSRRR